MENSKETSKMRKTASRIIRMRKKREPHGDEAAKFREIDQLLAEGDSETQPLTLNLPPILSKIPNSAPGFDLFDTGRVNWLFSESDLYPLKFVPSDEMIFGRPVSELDVTTFQNLLLNRIYELHTVTTLPGMRLFVVYLMACTTNDSLAVACRLFLKSFPCRITMTDALLLLCNFGASQEHVTVPIPNYLISKQKGGVCSFPLFNVEMVLEYLCDCVFNDRIILNDATQGTMQFLSIFALDRTIRGTPVFGTVMQFLSAVAAKCAEEFGDKTVADWMVAIVHPMNKLEICRFISAEKNFKLVLIGRTIKTLLPGEARKINLQRHIDALVRLCTDKVTEHPLEVYVIFQLLISLLPYLEIGPQDATTISRDIVAIESRVKELRDISDAMRLRAVCAQLRGLLLNSVGLKKL